MIAAFRGSELPILDIGTGTGRLSTRFAHETRKAVLGIDISLGMLDEARIKSVDLPFRPVCADALRLPFRSQYFGGVIMSAVLHFVADWKVALSEATRVLAEPGHLMILLGRRHKSDTPLRALLRQFRHFVDVPPPLFPALEEMVRFLKSLGYRYLDLPEVGTDLRSTPRQALALLDADAFPVTWNLAPDVRAKALSCIHDWAEKKWANHDQEIVAQAAWKWYCFVR